MIRRVRPAAVRAGDVVAARDDAGRLRLLQILEAGASLWGDAWTVTDWLGEGGRELVATAELRAVWILGSTELQAGRDARTPERRRRLANLIGQACA